VRARARTPKKSVPCEPPRLESVLYRKFPMGKRCDQSRNAQAARSAQAKAFRMLVHTHSRPLHASIFHAQDVLASSHRELRSRVAALKLSTYIIRNCKRRPVLHQRLHHFWPAMVDSKVQRHLPMRIFHGDLGTVLNEQRNDLGLIGLHRVVDERLMVLREHEERALVGVRGHGYIISKCTCWFRISKCETSTFCVVVL